MTDRHRDQVLQDDTYLIHPLQHPLDHENPVIYVKGEGATVTDIDGNTYIDGLSSLWNVNIGHGRRELGEAAAQQISELGYFSCYAGVTLLPPAQLAKRISELAPGHLNYTFFTSGGAVSNDSAIKTARFYWQSMGKTKKVKIISRDHAYHGVTMGAMNATGISSYWPGFESKLPNFLHVDAPYPYYYDGQGMDMGCGEAAAKSLEEAILREGPDTVAAFIGEPVQGAAGVIVPPDDYWPRVRTICSKYDVLLINDEVITGFGRIGHWFGVSEWDIEPDIITFAKGVTSGYLPLGGIIVSDAIHACIQEAPANKKWNHSFTYSGHPTCCAVALKNIEIIEEEGLIERARVMGDHLMKGLQSLAGMAHVGDIRGVGLMAAVEVVKDPASRKAYGASEKIGPRIVQEMHQRGVYTRCRGDSINFAPPLVVSTSQIDRMVEVARDAIQVVCEDVGL
jgi:putrescine aminotransferase